MTWILPGCRIVVIGAIVIAAGCALADCAGVAHAQDDLPQGTLDLARITAGEAGLERLTDDAPAIHAVLVRRAARRGVSWRRMARWYSGGHLDRSRADRRRWVAWLRPDGARPMGWPRTASWGRRRETWLDLVALSAAVLRGEVVASCQPDHYGSTDPRLPDLHRARRAGWERVDCGDTANGYWAVPWAPDVGLTTSPSWSTVSRSQAQDWHGTSYAGRASIALGPLWSRGDVFWRWDRRTPWALGVPDVGPA